MRTKRELVLLISVIIALGLVASSIFTERSVEEVRISSWSDVVKLLDSKAKSLKVRCYPTGKEVRIERGDAKFVEVLSLLGSSSVKRTVRKVATSDNLTVSVTVPYPYGYFLVFELENGSQISLDYGSRGTIWFETEETIYEVEVSEELLELIESALSRTEPLTLETQEEGLKLIVSLSSAEIKVGESLRINVTLLNLNNTANITIAALNGGMEVRILSQSNQTVYDVVCVIPGPTLPIRGSALGRGGAVPSSGIPRGTPLILRRPPLLEIITSRSGLTLLISATDRRSPSRQELM